MSSYSWKTQNETDNLQQQQQQQQQAAIDVTSALEKPSQSISTTDQDQPAANIKNSSTIKRRKAKKVKEEKEDGELDDENDENNTSPDDYEEYDDYDFDSDSKNSQASNKKTEQQAETPSNVITAQVAKTSPLPTLASELSTTIPEVPTILPPVAQSFSITNPYDIEYEDYDSDDDDYGNNKRLKIDERDDPPEQLANPPDKNEAENEAISEPAMTKESHSSDSGTETGKSVTTSNSPSKSDQQQTTVETHKPDAEKTLLGRNSTTTNLENDNEASSSSVLSTKSNSSSVITAISAVSSDSLVVSSEKEETNKSVKKEVNEEGSQSDKDTPPCANNSNKEDMMKVPALKIIFSNSNGSLPYVKTTPKDQLQKTSATTSKTSGKKDPASQEAPPTTPVKQPPESSNDSPSSSLRAKLPRSAARVASPVTTTPTAASLTASSYKTTSTRRSAAAAAAAALNTTGRASPSVGAGKETRRITEGSGDKHQGSSGGAGGDDSSNSNSSGSGTASGQQTQSGDAVEGVGTRRKLRSHTRLGGSEEPMELTSFSRGKASATAASGESSSSPLTVLGDNNSGQVNEETNESGVKGSGSQVAAEGCELSNSSTVETVVPAEVVSGSSSNNNSSSGLNLNEFMPTRKKRNRQQQQQLQEQLDLINEIDSLNASIAASLNQTPADGSDKSDQAANGSQGNKSESGADTDHTDQLSINPSLFNCIKKFVDLRQDVTKRREALMQSKIDVRLPKNFNEFIINRKSYLIKSNREAQKSIPFFKPPNDIPEDLRGFFSKQEKERYSLRLRHRVEQDKLIILFEQEVLRCFNKAAREAANQEIPFSFCSMIKDDEIYSMFRISEQASLSATTAPPILNSGGSGREGVGSGEQNCDQDGENGTGVEAGKEQVVSVPEPLSAEEVFSNNLNELRLKFQKLKDDCIKRQLNESDSLHAVQKMDFQAKLRELSNKYKNAMTSSTSANSPHSLSPINNLAAISLAAYNVISHFKQNDLHVPIVHVNNKFDLLDAPQHQFVSTGSSNASNSVAIYA